MANEEHLVILKQDVEVWNQWRQEHPRLLPDLRQARLRAFYPDSRFFAEEEDEPNWDWVVGMDLSQADLSYTNLYRASLPQALLSRSNLLCAAALGNSSRSHLLSSA